MTLLVVLIIIFILAPILYIALHKVQAYETIREIHQYIVEVDSGYNFSLQVYPSRWRPLFFENWLTPSFTIMLENLGQPLERGEVAVYFSHKSNEPFEEAAHPMKQVWGYGSSENLTNFQTGEVKHFTTSLESSNIDTSKRYFMRAVVTKWVPDEPPTASYRPETLFAYRVTRTIKIYSLRTLVSIVSSYGAVMVALLGILVTRMDNKTSATDRSEHVSATIPVEKPPRLEIQPNSEKFEVQHFKKKDEESQDIPIWQFQTSIFIVNPTNTPTGDAIIRTCFYTGRKNDWTSEISNWIPICLKKSNFPKYTATGDRVISLPIKDYGTAHEPKNIVPIMEADKELPLHYYQTASGEHPPPKVAHEPARSIGYGGCTAWQCIKEQKRRFKPKDRYEQWLTPQLADDPSKYLCEGTTVAVQLVKLIWYDESGNPFPPYIRYIPVQCVTDPNPKLGEPSKKEFRWADEFIEKLPLGVEPPKECVLQLPK